MFSLETLIRKATCMAVAGIIATGIAFPKRIEAQETVTKTISISLDVEDAICKIPDEKLTDEQRTMRCFGPLFPQSDPTYQYLVQFALNEKLRGKVSGTVHLNETELAEFILAAKAYAHLEWKINELERQTLFPKSFWSTSKFGLELDYYKITYDKFTLNEERLLSGNLQTRLEQNLETYRNLALMAQPDHLFADVFDKVALITILTPIPGDEILAASIFYKGGKGVTFLTKPLVERYRTLWDIAYKEEKAWIEGVEAKRKQVDPIDRGDILKRMLTDKRGKGRPPELMGTKVKYVVHGTAKYMVSERLWEIARDIIAIELMEQTKKGIEEDIRTELEQLRESAFYIPTILYKTICDPLSGELKMRIYAAQQRALSEEMQGQVCALDAQPLPIKPLNAVTEVPACLDLPSPDRCEYKAPCGENRIAYSAVVKPVVRTKPDASGGSYLISGPVVDLFLFDKQTGRKERIANIPEINRAQFSCSPQGRYVIYFKKRCHELTDCVIYVYDIERQRHRKVMETGRFRMTYGTITEPAISDDGTIILLGAVHGNRFIDSFTAVQMPENRIVLVDGVSDDLYNHTLKWKRPEDYPWFKAVQPKICEGNKK